MSEREGGDRVKEERNCDKKYLRLLKKISTDIFRARREESGVHDRGEAVTLSLPERGRPLIRGAGNILPVLSFLLEGWSSFYTRSLGPVYDELRSFPREKLPERTRSFPASLRFPILSYIYFFFPFLNNLTLPFRNGHSSRQLFAFSGITVSEKRRSELKKRDFNL